MNAQRTISHLGERVGVLGIVMVVYIIICFGFLFSFWLPYETEKDWTFIKVQLLIGLGTLGLWVDQRLYKCIQSKAICNVAGALITVLILIWTYLLLGT